MVVGSPKVVGTDLVLKHAAAITDPVSPGVLYSQAEVVAIRDALVAVLAALRSADIIA